MKESSGRCVAMVEGLSHAYEGRAVLDQIDLRIPVGGMAGLIGPDGSGKSTLLGLIAGTRRLQRGRVEVLGGDMADPVHRRHC